MNILFAKSDQIFSATFDRTHIQQLIAEAETTVENDESAQNTFNLDALVVNFWKGLEISFLTDYISQNIVDLFH